MASSLEPIVLGTHPQKGDILLFVFKPASAQGSVHGEHCRHVLVTSRLRHGGPMEMLPLSWEDFATLIRDFTPNTASPEQIQNFNVSALLGLMH